MRKREQGKGWFEAGGGLPAALEWLAAGVLTGDPRSEAQALSAVADGFAGPAREGLLAGAALLLARSELEPKPPLIHGTSPAARIANLDLAPPGSDPRRRAAALSELGDALGDDAAVDAAAMGGWAQLAALNLDGARAMFESVVAARPTDLSAWEGLRGCAERNGDRSLRARASAELGALCADPRRGAAFWEEAALLWLSLGDADNADRALDASFARDATRPTAFDRLFRRTRDRRDNEKLLSIIGRRLGVTDEPNEIQKLFWEQARVLREIGDHDGALKALEHVTLLDPDHVGALALLGEVNIRRGQFEEAAASLGRLASLEGAPAKNRVTAGVAAVDLYENKLRRFDKALDVLLTLHAAKLSTLPVRERLAKAAARNADWTVATSALEELMNERPERAGRIEAARLAMVIHRDCLGAQGALAAVVKLLSELPSDDEALELLLRIDVPSELQRELLVQARRLLVELLRQHPMDPSRARRLFDVAQALGDDRLAQATLGALAALGANDPGTQQAFAQIASRKPRTPQVAATDAVLRAILAPGDEGPLADLFALLGPTLAEALGPNLATCGVGRRDRIDPRSGLALRNEIASWAGALRLNELELYVGGKDPAGVQGVAGEPPALIVGVGINSPLAPLTRGRVARELLALARGTTIVRWRDDLAIAAIVIAACRFADVRIEHPPYAILAEIERLLGRALTRKTRRLLPEVCSAIVAHRGEARAWSQRAPCIPRIEWPSWPAAIPASSSATSWRCRSTSSARPLRATRGPKSSFVLSFRLLISTFEAHSGSRGTAHERPEKSGRNRRRLGPGARGVGRQVLFSGGRQGHRHRPPRRTGRTCLAPPLPAPSTRPKPAPPPTPASLPLDEDDADATLIARIPEELLRRESREDTSARGPSRGGLSQLFSRESTSSAETGPRPPTVKLRSDPPEEVVTSAQSVPSQNDPPSVEPLAAPSRRSISRSRRSFLRPVFRRFLRRDSHDFRKNHPAEHPTALPLPPPPSAGPPRSSAEPRARSQQLTIPAAEEVGGLAPLDAGAEGEGALERLTSEAPVEDWVDDDTLTGRLTLPAPAVSDAPPGRSRATTGPAPARESSQPPAGPPSIAPSPPHAPGAYAAAPRAWVDEKPASSWLDDGTRAFAQERAAWLEEEARMLPDKLARARGLLVCSEMVATAGDRARAHALADEARALAPFPRSPTSRRGA